MSDAPSVDVFTFVAVRPPQLSARPHALEDDRQSEDDQGDSPALRLESNLEGSRGRAVEVLAGVDAGQFAPFVDAHLRLLSLYADATPPTDEEVEAALAASDLVDVEDARLRATEDDAWTAYYCCCALGPGCAQRAEPALATLRVSRFVRRRRAGILTDPLRLLTTAAAVPVAFLPFAEGPEHREQPEGDNNPSTKRVRSVLREITAASRLRERLTSDGSAASGALAGSAVPVIDRTLSGDHLDVRIASGTARRFADIPNDLSSAEHQLAATLNLAPLTLDDAVQTLDGRLATLCDRAAAWSELPVMKGVMAGVKKGIEKKIDMVWLPGLLGKDPDPSTSKDEDVTGRIRVLGIGDLKVVKQSLLAYEPGEVAHIENVMAKETRSRTHRVLDRTEDTFFTAQETSETTERDTQSTERFELKRETERTIQEDMSIQAGMTVAATYGPVSMTAHGDFAYSTSKHESEKVSSNLAKEIVDKSRSKIEKRSRTERTTKTTHEIEETNLHQFANEEATHIVGVYRWVDKRYRAQIYNYGVRMMLEFVVPEPAAYYKASLAKKKTLPSGLTAPPEFVGKSGKPLTLDDITEDTFHTYIARYAIVGITPPPPKVVHVGLAMSKDGIELGKTFSDKPKELVVPVGYTLTGWTANASLIVKNHPKFYLQVSDERFELINKPHSDAPDGNDWSATSGIAPDEVTGGPVPLSMVSYDVLAFAVNVSAKCTRTTASYNDWRAETFQKIAAAYAVLKKEYDAAIALAEAREPTVFVGTNPLANRVTQAVELKKLCLTILTGQHFSTFEAITEPADAPRHIPEIEIGRALDIGPIVQFFEQAFEWEQLTYLYYPYFWGGKRRWVEKSTLTDPDPDMEAFLKAGSARVVIPVSPAYAASIAYFLACKPMPLAKKIWSGGTPPDIKDPLYRSIAEELRDRTDDLQGAVAEGDPWEFTLPTTLVWLQGDATLPTF